MNRSVLSCEPINNIKTKSLDLEMWISMTTFAIYILDVYFFLELKEIDCYLWIQRICIRFCKNHNEASGSSTIIWEQYSRRIKKVAFSHIRLDSMITIQEFHCE